MPKTQPQSVKESYETTLLRRQKDRLEQAKMKKELEEKKRLEEEEKEEERRRAETTRETTVAQPGVGKSNKRFMPKKRGRIGL